MNRKAFTVIELTVAITIIVVLAGLVMYAMRSAGNTARIQATSVTLENLKGMLAEYEIQTKLGVVPPNGWLANVPLPPGPLLPTPLGADFWHNITGAAVFPPVALDDFPLINPGLVSDTAANSPRFTSCATNNTAIALSELMRIPANSAVVAKLPPTSLTQATAGNVVLDAWGNPVIFVPARGLDGVTVGGTARVITNGDTLTAAGIPPWIATSAYAAGMDVYHVDSSTIYRAANPIAAAAFPGNPPPNADPNWIRVNVRGFFASAGPDGNFSTGDDNLYSFEQ